MKKTAVVYDKWLSSLGGGEIVACCLAKILDEKGYDVTFVCGKEVSKEVIKRTLGIDMSGIKFVEIWNDEVKIRSLVRDKDLFINSSFMDYSYGEAKKNIYYTHFPTRSYGDLKGKVMHELVIPVLAKIVKPSEFMTKINAPVVINSKPAYLLEKKNRIALSYLNVGEEYVLEFELYLESFYKSQLDRIKWSFVDAEVLDKKFTINHNNNTIRFKIRVKTQSATIYLELDYDNFPDSMSSPVFLMYPKISINSIDTSNFKYFYDRVNNRLRAGIFVNSLQRLRSYQQILVHSEYVKKWVRNYWHRSADVLYPPVEMLFEKYDLKKNKKEKIICSVGRFFTLGHGKKQEVMIEAFKKFYDKGHKDWQLHLVGGLGTEPTSIELAKKLKTIAADYPVYFHFNVPRTTVEKIYLRSSIYWHAAGFDESESGDPIKFEHFGIAPVEAISLGCVPILFRGGGLIEIIEKSGFNLENYTFKTIDELVDKTIKFIDGGAQINWSKTFKLLDKNFSYKAFRASVIKNLLS